MRTYIRRACVPAVLLSVVVLAGCSSKTEAHTAPATHEAVQTPAGAPSSAAPSSSPAPVLSVGQTGTYAVGETDDTGDTGDTFKVTGKMQVTVVSAKYVTAAEIGTTNKPQGQYVELTLTLQNVGSAPAQVETYGNMKWEDTTTAAQEATTLEGVGDGPDLDTTYKPGQGVTGKLVLDVAHRGGTVSYTYTEDPNADAAFKVKLPA